MIRLIIWAFLATSYAASAHEVIYSLQHLDIRRQNTTGWQHDLTGKISVNRKFEIGLQGTYLERFDLYERRGGGILKVKASDRLVLELRHLQGNGNNILPRTQTIASGYFALSQGVSPYLVMQDVRYSLTHVSSASLGVELEKFANVILLPQVTYGKANFRQTTENQEVYSYGLRAIYYREKEYSLFTYGFAGKEASQAIIGRSSTITKTLVGGVGGGYFWTPNVRTELLVDQTDYKDLKNSFLTTTLNTAWTFL